RNPTTIQRLEQSAGLHCGSETYDERRCGAVIAELRSFVRDNPRYHDAAELLARSLSTASILAQTPEQQDTNRRESLALFRKLASARPKDARLKMELANLTQDQNERMRLLLEIVSMKDAPSLANVDLAMLLLERGQLQSAFLHYSQYLASLQRPEMDAAGHGVQFALELASRGRKDLSIAILKDLLKRTQPSGLVEQCFIFKNVNIQEFGEAPELQAELRRLIPNCTDLEHRNEAVRLQLQGHIPEAIREMKLQIDSNSRYAESYSILAELYVLNHQPEEAVKVAEQFLTSRKDEAAEVCANIDLRRPRQTGSISMDFAEKVRRVCVERGYLR
ncbi:MAG: hypothetical protein ABI822_17405, partial [Bryobacteraceae bacterium]